jgi:hypothetical protein
LIFLVHIGLCYPLFLVPHMHINYDYLNINVRNNIEVFSLFELFHKYL